MRHTIKVREDGSEIVPYSFEGYHVHISRGQISCFRNATADTHWHPELEFSYVLSGHMTYRINGEEIVVAEGQGILIQGQQVHSNYSVDGVNCVYICILLSPTLLCATPHMEAAYIRPVLDGFPAPYFLLSAHEPWQEQILSILQQIYSHKEESFAPLMIQSDFYQIWRILSEAFSESHTVRTDDAHLRTFKSLLSFVQRHYAEKLTLGDIAYAGNISQSSCLLLFKKYIKETPIHYLNAYRLKIGAELLRKTDLSITEVAYSTGFSGSSYFSEKFRQYYNISQNHNIAKE